MHHGSPGVDERDHTRVGYATAGAGQGWVGLVPIYATAHFSGDLGAAAPGARGTARQAPTGPQPRDEAHAPLGSDPRAPSGGTWHSREGNVRQPPSVLPVEP